MKKWTEAEEKYLKERWGKDIASKIGEKLNKSTDTVRMKALRMGLIKSEKDKKRNCRVCVFLGRLGSGEKYCDYMVLTGERRGCDVEECDKKMTRKEAPKELLKKINKRKELSLH